ncbi:hypothetical protein [Methylobacterium sp. A54F]
MILPLFTEAELAMTRAIFPFSMEAPVDAQNPVATRLTLMGFRGPYAVRSANEAVVECASGKLVAFVPTLPDVSARDRMWLAERLADGLNERCGYPAPDIAAPYVPHHIAGLIEGRDRSVADEAHRDAAE